MTRTDDRERIDVYVEPVETSLLKITWMWNGCRFLPYSIDRGMVIRSSDKIRQCLKNLVSHALAHGVSGSAPLLKSLAEAGSRLYQTLFFETGYGNPREVKSWLKSLYREQRLVITVGDRIYVPWGLIYDSDPKALDDGIDVDLFENFWCLKYLLASKYYRINPMGVKTISRSIEVIPVINRTVFETASRDVAKAEGSIVNQLASGWKGPAFSKQEFFNRWKKITGNDILVYFYCHADGTRLALSADEMISLDDFRLELRGKPLSRRGTTTTVVFLNGCSTAIGDPNGGFLEATASPDFCGFLGTETEVPDVFALRFGSAFLREWLNGAGPVFLVMDVLRRKHWPLSLLYSICCFPEFQIEKKDKFAGLSEVGTGNFSESEIGNRVLVDE